MTNKSIATVTGAGGDIGRGIATFGHPAYPSASAGLIRFSRSVAREYGRYGVHGNFIAPGTVQTQAWKVPADCQSGDFAN